MADTGDLKRDIQSVLENGHPIERRVHRADGTAHYLMQVQPYRGRNNVIDGVLVTFVNVTTLVVAETQQRTMVEELNHRVRNMLTVVGAIANQTLARSPSPESFAEAFLGRLQSMGKSYTLVSRENWGDVLLHDIVHNELEGHIRETDGRIKLSGPDIPFAPPQALAIGLVLHELATNAVKYGALSTPKGSIAVTWGIENGGLNIAWLERDGARVKEPAHNGFGTVLIERELKSALGAGVAFDYAPQGLGVKISIPFDFEICISVGTRSEMNDMLRRSILLIEDEPLVAMDVEMALEAAGFRVVGAAASNEAAFSMLRTEIPDLTILDLNLGHETSFPVFDHLAELRRPFIVVSGHSRHLLPAQYRDQPFLQKPYRMEALLRLVRETLETADAKSMFKAR